MQRLKEERPKTDKPLPPLPAGAKRYSGKYPTTDSGGYFVMAAVKTSKAKAIDYLKRTYPWMEKAIIQKNLRREK